MGSHTRRPYLPIKRYTLPGESLQERGRQLQTERRILLCQTNHVQAPGVEKVEIQHIHMPDEETRAAAQRFFD